MSKITRRKFKVENKVSIFTFFEVFLILILASHNVERLFLRSRISDSLVESMAFSKFEAIKLKNQGGLVGLVKPII